MRAAVCKDTVFESETLCCEVMVRRSAGLWDAVTGMAGCEVMNGAVRGRLARLRRIWCGGSA